MKYRWLALVSVFVVIFLEIRYVTASSPTYVKLIGVATAFVIFFICIGIAAASIFRMLASRVTKTTVFIIFNCSAILPLCMIAYHRRTGESVAMFLVSFLIELALFNGTLWASASEVKDWKVRA